MSGETGPQVLAVAADVAGSIHTESVMFLPLRLSSLAAAAVLALAFVAPAQAELKPPTLAPTIGHNGGPPHSDTQ